MRIIRVVGRADDHAGLLDRLRRLLDFLAAFPFPKDFLGDSKFEVGPHQCILRGRDVKTREIKTVRIRSGDTVRKVAETFHYFG